MTAKGLSDATQGHPVIMGFMAPHRQAAKVMDAQSEETRIPGRPVLGRPPTKIQCDSYAPSPARWEGASPSAASVSRAVRAGFTEMPHRLAVVSSSCCCSSSGEAADALAWTCCWRASLPRPLALPDGNMNQDHGHPQRAVGRCTSHVTVPNVSSESMLS